jgi:hypothetical protein
MCESCDVQDVAHRGPSPRWSRRSLLGLIGAGMGAVVAAAVGDRAGAAGISPRMPEIVARSTWGGDLPVKGLLQKETPRFLLVHHTQSPGSDYLPKDVPHLLRAIYRYHTGPAKNWPDVAYNFFVDRYGGIHEGRTGSIVGPVRGSATGGNQGYSQLCCFLGDTSAVPPTPAAQGAMVDLLAWLAGRYGIDTRPGATASFVSLGSNRYKPGAPITARTISGHRDVTFTECPGDACYALLAEDFPVRVTRRRATR